jgi:phosphatidylinositol glycan class N
VILSISVEGLFFLSYSALLVVWVELEAAIRPGPSQTDKTTDVPAEESGAGGVAMAGKKKKTTTVFGYQPRADDLRIALFFLFFVQVAFFGTGNVASIS